MRKTLIYVIVPLVVLGVASSCVFTVDRTEFVYLTQFGRHVNTFDGETDAGLHFKWPWPVQSVQRLDHRLQVFDLPGAELLTHDAKGKTIDKTLTIDAYVCWQIADRDGVDRFIRTVGSAERARSILGQRISSRLGAEIGNMSLDDLVSVAPENAIESRMERLRERLMGKGDGTIRGPAGEEPLTNLAAKNYGIKLVDIRLRRFNHPLSVRDDIFARIRSEREKKAADYRSEGDRRAADIRSAAERAAKDTLTDAQAQALRLRKEADAKADAIRNEAHNKDRDFYTFLQKLETYGQILGNSKDVLLLSSKHEIFDLLLKPPRPTNNSTTAPGTGAAMSKQPGKSGGQQ